MSNETKAPSHQELVVMAAQWLKRKCAVVITELATTGETPDAIGWQGTTSTLIECKISRADFLVDKAKWFRREAWQGIGTKRYFMTPAGLVRLNELPPKWGLLEIRGGSVRVACESGIFDEANDRHEIGILLSVIRRMGKTAPSGVSVKCYTIETKCQATLGVAADGLPGAGTD